MMKKVLVVDDSPNDFELTKLVLHSCVKELDVVVAYDGEEALRELIRSSAFDLILLDLHIPKIDGFEILKELSSKPFLSGVPVIILSTSRDTSDRVRTRMLGALDYVEKSIDYSVFRQELKDTLTRHGLCVEPAC
jgi:DNA-binding response OmpR family regulator